MSLKIAARFLSYSAFVIRPFFRRSSSLRRRSSVLSGALAVVGEDVVAFPDTHAVCSGCGRIEDVFDPRLDTLPSPKAAGFAVEGHSVHFHGLCAKCAKAPQTRSKQEK